jgi:membrane associated rhomboid family serine protease
MGPRPAGRIQFGPGRPSPFIKWMLIINGGVFLLQMLPMWRLELILGLTPAAFYAEFPNRLYQIATYMFLHSTGHFFHLLFNMAVLWMFGTEIERAWGTRPFAKFYLLAGLCGAVLTLAIFPDQQIPTIGASGALYGVLVAYWMMFPNRVLYIWMILPVKVKWAIPGLFLISFLFSGGGVAHMAHLGGALFGLIYLKLDMTRFGAGRWIKNLRYKRQETKLNRNREKAQDAMERVDAILDKINEVGMDKLTAEERRFLQEASSELSEQDRGSGKNR